MATHSTTRSTTKAKVLTAITVAAAGVAAYAVGTLSNDLISQQGPAGTYTQGELRRSCLLMCEHNGGSPCWASVDAATEAACQVRVGQCMNACPAPDANAIVLRLANTRESMPVGEVGKEYRRYFVAGPYETATDGRWELDSGALPPGIQFNPATGVFSGAPTRANSYAFGVAYVLPAQKGVRDAQIRIKSDISWTIAPATAAAGSPTSATGVLGGAALSPLDITTPVGTIRVTRNQPFELRLSGYGVSPGKEVWSISYGRLPEGLKLDDRTGRIYGTPTEKAGSYRFGVSFSSAEHLARSLVVAEDATIELVDAEAAGTAAAPGTGATQGTGGSAASRPLTVAEREELEANTVFFPEALPVGRVGEPYSVPVSLNEARARAWTVTGLPQGLNFIVATQVLSGTPLVDGTYPVVMTATRSDGTNSSVTKKYTLTINRQQVAVAGEVKPAAGEVKQVQIDGLAPDGVARTAYSAQLRALGGPGGYRWRFTAAAPSSGWKLSADGILSNTDPREGVYTFNVSVSDQAGGMVYGSGEVIVNVKEVKQTAATTTDADKIPEKTPATNPVAGATDPKKETTTATTPTTPAAATTLAFIDAVSYPDGTVAAYYNARPFDVTGGKAPYTYAITVGTLPDGLTTTTNGGVQGTPTRAGTFSFTMRVRDSAGDTVQAIRSIRVAAAPVAASSGGGGGSGSSGGGGYTVVMSPTPNSEDAATQARLAVLSRLGIRVHDLVKLEDDGDVNTQHDTTVYYIGSDGRRHFFPNPKVYFAWFPDFSGVRIVSGASLAEIPLGANVTYRPGVRMVKFESENKVYVVEQGRRLRWIQSEADASSVYGPSWNRHIDDIPVTFYTDYVFGSPISTASLVSPSQLMTSVSWPSQVLP